MRLSRGILARVWRWYAHSSGIFLVVLAVTYGIVATFNQSGRVITVRRADLLTPTVDYMGVVRYTISYERHMSCPGTRMISFMREVPRESVSISAPSTQLSVGTVEDAMVSIDLPPSVYPGPWRIVVSLESACPTHRRHDLVVDFKILVTPNVG